MYKIIVEKRADKDTRKIPKSDLRRILEQLEAFKESPRPPSSKKLTDQGGYRARVGEYRVLYYVDDEKKVVTVYRIKRRGEGTYR